MTTRCIIPRRKDAGKVTRAPQIVTAALCLLGVSGPGGSAQAPAPLFIDATRESGLDFIHINGATGERFFPEVIGAGGALFDYDNDGDLDLFVVQGSALRPGATGAAPPRSRLYRNDPVQADRQRFRFTDVTDRSGIAATGYGMGAATGDFDNDGWIDLYITSLGSNRLLRNRGDGTFADVTGASGTDDPRWSTSATFFDYDRDGLLDLFVTNYVDFHVDMKRACFSAGSAPDYCNPSVYDPVPDRLFRNNGDGTFADVSALTGIARERARGLGVVAADVNADGWTDVYVANDGDPNHLWINDARGRFTDEALLSGVALNRAGQAQGGMGVDAGDIDGDADVDLVVSNLDNESNTMDINLGGGLCEDRTLENGVVKHGVTGFGARFVDIDNDGWLDLAIVNGAVRHVMAQVQRGDPYPLKQSNLLLRNEGGRQFVDVTGRAGAAFSAPAVGRGLSVGDLDNDGDLDLIVFNNSGPVRVLLNEAARGRHWLGVRVIDRHDRDALHTRLELVRRAGSVWRRVQTDGSYASAGDARVVFGLGEAKEPHTVRVYWAGGKAEEFGNLAVDRYWALEAGKPPRVIESR
jgi:hypothetical protein